LSEFPEFNKGSDSISRKDSSVACVVNVLLKVKIQAWLSLVAGNGGGKE